MSIICSKYESYLRSNGISYKKNDSDNNQLIVINYDVGISGVEYVCVSIVFNNNEAPGIVASNFMKLPRNINIKEFGLALRDLNTNNDRDNIPFQFGIHDNELLVEHSYQGVAVYVNEPRAIDERVDELLQYVKDCTYEIRSWF